MNARLEVDLNANVGTTKYGVLVVAPCITFNGIPVTGEENEFLAAVMECRGLQWSLHISASGVAMVKGAYIASTLPEALAKAKEAEDRPAVRPSP